MKKKILTIIVLFFLFSCNQNSNNILPKKEFINLLIDIHIADGYVVEKALFDKDLENDSTSYYNSVFKKYNINRTDFDENINHYTKDFTEFEEIYNEVVVILEDKIQIVDSLRRNDTTLIKNE